MTDLLSKLTVAEVLSKEVFTVKEDTLVEDAAHLMADNDIGGLPVLRDDVLVGIITESDIFRLFIELFGTRKRGLRVTAVVPEVKGELAKMTSAVAERGGNIISIGTFDGDDLTNGLLLLKVEDLTKETLTDAILPFVKEIIDIREV
jgi:acetoin utilization protein AcuB